VNERGRSSGPSGAGSKAIEDRTVPLADAVFCAFDLETTGLSSFSRIVEVGAVRFTVGEKGEHFETLVDPGCAIPRGAMSVHGITDEMVAGAPQAREVLEELVEFASGCVLVAHNARYDVSVMSTELVRAGMELPPNDVICTIKASKRFLPQMPNYRLQTVAGVLQIDPGGWHRALSDAVAAKQIFEIAVTSEERWHERDLAYVLERCAASRLGSNVEMDTRVPAELEDVRQAIGEAIDSGARMTFVYSGRRGRWPTEVKPLSTFSAKGSHYLEAECKDGYTHSFRLDKIVRIMSIETGEQ
jgi:DNA polymerase III epsilon subunit family exonuclease